MEVNKKDLSERDIVSKFILPGITNAGWSLDTQIREEVSFTDGRIFVKGKTVVRGQKKARGRHSLLQAEHADSRGRGKGQ